MDSFDPYQHWLGIPSQMRPLNHYILLGVRIFEDDPAKINAAYEARMSLLKQVQSGPRGEDSQQVISEIGMAKRDLLDRDRKTKYDLGLKKLLEDRQRELDSPEDENDKVAGVPAQGVPAQLESSERQASPILPAALGSEVAASAPAVAPPSQSSPSELDQIPRSQSKDPSTNLSDELEDDSEELSAFSYLKDIRYLVALLTLSVVVMTATILLLRPDQDPANQATANQPDSELAQAPPAIQMPSDPTASLARIEQGSDSSFELPVGSASLSGTDIKLGTGGITGWAAGDEAAWMLVVKDRRNGYFNCKITYQAEQESAFEIQLGNRKPRSLTIYPHDKDFEEEFIIRLGKASEKTNEQTLKIKATQAGAHQVEIKRVRLQPNR